jgi:hypothetical protein
VKPLKVFAVGAEATVIATLAVSSYHIAFNGASGTSDWLAGAPILTVVALESLRLPLAFNLVKSRLTAILMTGVMLVGISAITGEAASIAFENLIFQRTRPVIEAETALRKVEIGHGTLDEVNARRKREIDRLTADLADARKHREEIGAQKPEMQPVAADRTCSRIVGAGKHAHRVTWNCNSAIQQEQASGNADTQRAHMADLKAASDQVAQAKAALDAASANPPDMRASDEALKLAKQKVADARSMNPMFRVAAAWQRTPVEDLTSTQFEQVKHYAVIMLATATAVVSGLAAVISSLPERGSKGDGKLARAIRATLAARRKTLRRIGGVVRTEIKQQTKVVYVPVDVATGKVLDPAFQPAPPTAPTSPPASFKVVG